MSSEKELEEFGAWFNELLGPGASDDRLKNLINRDLRAKIERMLNSLTHEEASILRKRFGLGEEKAQSVEALAVELDLPPAAIRDIERRALLKLKHPSRSGHLRSFGQE